MATIAATLTITPAHPAFAAEVSGVDLTRRLDDATFERIAVAFDDYSVLVFRGQALSDEQDRKSTRLNSSHGYISYAVFCLKKKKKYKETLLFQKKKKKHKKIN